MSTFLKTHFVHISGIAERWQKTKVTKFLLWQAASRAMSVRNTSYQQVHDLYELCSDGRSLQEFCRMSGVSNQKYMEWLRGQDLSKPSKKQKPDSEPVMGTVSIPDAPMSQPSVQTIDRPIRDLNVRLANGTFLKMHHVSLDR